MWTHPGKKLLFMGSDFGQWNEWNHDAELQWDLLQWETHGGIKKMVADLNALYRREPALHEVDFERHRLRVDRLHAPRRQRAGLHAQGQRPGRLSGGRLQLHAGRSRRHHPIGVPQGGWYQEIFNSDSQFYGGTNVGNFPGAMAARARPPRPALPDSIDLPPLGVAVFKPQRETP